MIFQDSKTKHGFYLWSSDIELLDHQTNILKQLHGIEQRVKKCSPTRRYFKYDNEVYCIDTGDSNEVIYFITFLQTISLPKVKF
jgi:hypothetical protein